MKIKSAILAFVMFVAVLSAAEVNVMSFNIRYGSANDGVNKWSARKELVFDVIRKHSPDMIGLQEALRFQIDEIMAAVPGYVLVGEGREGGEKGEYSAVLYKKSLYDCTSSGTFWLSDTPEIPSKTWGNTCIRICTWVRLVDRRSKKSFYYFNTHLDHQSQPSREKSVRLIVQRIIRRKHKDPFVLSGDFNVAENNSVVMYLKGKSAADNETPLLMVDTFRMLHPDEKTVGTFNGFKGKTDGAKIDYIFVPLGVDVTDARILRPPEGGRCPSDHFPVTARLSL